VTESSAETTEGMLARVRASFDRQAMMSTLGVEVTSVEPGQVEMSLRHDDGKAGISG
jgi:acyl-coenzyme A thioesterase PaaI-like protein